MAAVDGVSGGGLCDQGCWVGEFLGEGSFSDGGERGLNGRSWGQDSGRKGWEGRERYRVTLHGRAEDEWLIVPGASFPMSLCRIWKIMGSSIFRKY